MSKVITFKSELCDWLFCCVLFGIALCLGPIRQLDFFSKMPGDIFDARLNLYFLENIYAYISGNGSSLIHLSFFYPFPYVSGFSDNLYGAAAIYLFARYCTLAPEAAFQFWFICGYLLNFVAAFYAIRIFGPSNAASAIGAIFFTFGLPASAQMGHAQLQYRFGLALSIAYFYLFLTRYNWRAFLFSGFWLVWQFFCSIYLGFFAGLMIGVMLICYLVANKVMNKIFSVEGLAETWRETHFFWTAISSRDKTVFFTTGGILIIALLSLFYPYLRVTGLYHFARSWDEIAAMSPRMSSYLLADHSLIWGAISEKIQGLPMRGEHQLFIGLIPFCLLILTSYLMFKSFDGAKHLTWFIVSLVTLIILTLNFHGYSLWHFLYKLPVFSALRAVSRFTLVFMFPVSVFLAVAVDLGIKYKSSYRKYFLAAVSAAMLLEVSAVNARTSLRDDWLTRLKSEQSLVPKDLEKASILFFAQRSLYFELEELDAMFVAQSQNLPTLNGYSGALPHHYRAQYTDDCAEYPRRILLYLEFLGQNENSPLYKQLAQRVRPIGFAGCQDGWKTAAPMTFSRQPLTRESISHLSLEMAPNPKRLETSTSNATTYLAIKIINRGAKNVSALSLVDRPLRLAWRIMNKDGVSGALWSDSREDQPKDGLPQGYRRDLPGDIAAGGSVEILAPIPKSVLQDKGLLEFSLVQEATLWGFSLNQADNIWGQDVGVSPLRVDLSAL